MQILQVIKKYTLWHGNCNEAVVEVFWSNLAEILITHNFGLKFGCCRSSSNSISLWFGGKNAKVNLLGKWAHVTTPL